MHWTQFLDYYTVINTQTLQTTFLHAYQPYARAPNTYCGDYLEQSSYLFSLKNSRPCRNLNSGPPRYQADILPIELAWMVIKELYLNGMIV